jgi:hypothetical protein
MTNIARPDDRGADAHARIHALVGAYPNLTEDELGDLLHWYRHEASAYDAAMLSARDDIRMGYKRFYKDHIERISPRDVVVIVVGCILSIGLLYGFIYLLP